MANGYIRSTQIVLQWWFFFLIDDEEVNEDFALAVKPDANFALHV